MRLFLLALLALASLPSRADGPNAEELLRAADRARGGLDEGITWNVEVVANEEGNATNKSFLVKARGVDALSEATAPPRNKGEMMLFNDRTLWFVKPGLKKPVSISARQKLSGDAANGDIASTNYARDYDGTVVGEEAIEGEEAWKLELKARAKNVTYDRIRYWISKSRRLGIKAEFLTLDGEVFKSATFAYGNSLELGGKKMELVSEMRIRDAVVTDRLTLIKFSAPRSEKHAPSIFNINNVIR
jgi:hypothetical protein